MSLLSAESYRQHQAPMYINLKEDLEEGEPLFIAVCSQKKNDGTYEDRYIMRRNFFVDNHLGFGIDEKVSVGEVENSHNRTIYALGVWEIGELQLNGRHEIKPTWHYSETQLADLLGKVRMADEARAVHMSYKELKSHVSEANRMVA